MTNIFSENTPQKSSSLLAKENLLLKLNIIKTWIKEGIPWEASESGTEVRNNEGCRTPIYFPTSLRSFNKWNSEQYDSHILVLHNQLREIKGNGSDTLNKNSDIKSLAIESISELSKAALIQSDSEGPNRIKKYSKENERLTIFIKNQGRELVQIQRRNLELADQYNGLLKTHQSEMENLYEHYKELETENEGLKRTISDLKKQLMKISSIKKVN